MLLNTNFIITVEFLDEDLKECKYLKLKFEILLWIALRALPLRNGAKANGLCFFQKLRSEKFSIKRNVKKRNKLFENLGFYRIKQNNFSFKNHQN